MKHQTQAERDNDLLLRCYAVAKELSRDPSTQNGAILVDSFGHALAFGANTPARGVAMSPERWERLAKYQYVEHAERNAIYAAAAAGVCTSKLRMYCCWAACPDCARAIIQAGIVELVTHKPANEKPNPRWDDLISVAYGMLKEAGVRVRHVEGSLGWNFQVLRNGEMITP